MARPLGGAVAIEGQAVTHAGYPGAELLRIAEAVEFAIGAEESVLDNFFRVGAIAKHSVGHVKNEAVTFAEPLLEVSSLVAGIFAGALGPFNGGSSAFHGE